MNKRYDVRRRRETAFNQRIRNAVNRSDFRPNFVAVVQSRNRGVEIEISGYGIAEAIYVLEQAADNLRHYAGSTGRTDA